MSGRRNGLVSGIAWIGGSAAAFLAAACLLPWIGSGSIGVDRVFAKAAPDYPIFVELRVSRTLLGLLAGGALSLTGALFQSMLRDSLAEPYTLGVSAGAALGAVLTLAFDFDRLLGVPATWVGALSGAAIVMLIVASAAWKSGRLSGVRLLLSGIALNSICSAFILLTGSVVRERHSISITQWLLGNVDSVSYPAVSGFALVVLVTSVVVISQARGWNLMAVGESWAASRGADVKRLTIAGYCCGCLLTAGAIALTGPIGFVGLIVPHLVRSRISPDNRILMPCSLLLGGVLLAGCDTIGRVVLAPAELPAGAVMAVVGGPYLVWLVRRRF
ncbi:MAG TPA: iron ABC transporter permease [Bryobacteraceae bacterium]|nr:iron ABC transporter permease [Bryobacteraceae bacterium]